MFFLFDLVGGFLLSSLAFFFCYGRLISFASSSEELLLELSPSDIVPESTLAFVFLLTCLGNTDSLGFRFISFGC